ncbi:MAG TPA: histidine kinase [Bryobacteraceae bacterium]|nr:histidine kinase [Bryobacteraceae bacterium]
MLGYKLLYLASLITFTFGALTFFVLTLYYWRERRMRRLRGRGLVFPALTVVCATAFLINLLLQIPAALSADSNVAAGLTLALGFVTGLLPPLLFHLIYSEEQRDLPGRRLWPWLLAGFYASSGLTAALRGLEDIGLVSTGWGDQLESVPALMLGAAGALGLLVQFLSGRTLKLMERHHRLWNRVLLCLTLLSAAANLAWPGTLVSLFPDYLVLSFFCVTLYYQERLVFFDLLIKRGAFFAVALVGLTLFFALASRIFERLPFDWSRPWICALLLLPFWLMAPWIYRRLEQSIDQVWLRRRYSPADAERQFVHDIQAAVTEEDLRRRATESLSDIFRAVAEVGFTSPCHVPSPSNSPVAEILVGQAVPPVKPAVSRPPDDDGAHSSLPPDGGLEAELEQNASRVGWISLSARLNSIPFLSDDRRLLQSLARTLSVVLENVRFRQQRLEQEEREQQLRWLASRAELKALRAQINPHFLFNALNAIAGLIPVQPQLADETVQQLSEVFRYTLRKSEKEWVRLDEEVEFVTAYLQVERARFGERLETDLAVDPAARAIPVPTMTVQPLIENAIKHGVSAVEGRGHVRLRATIQGEFLYVEVFDNGPGFPPGFSLADPGAPSGHGLRNVIERLTGYYGHFAQLRWESGKLGTRVWLTIPIAGVAQAVPPARPVCPPPSESVAAANGAIPLAPAPLPTRWEDA